MTSLRTTAITIGAILITAATLCSCLWQNSTHIKTPDTPAAQLLNVETPDGLQGEIINYHGFTVNFNPQHHQPNYVAWELTASETDGPIDRSNNFAPDPEVIGCATLDDYRKSGYDRGHMAPSGDMKWDKRAMDACFLLTNMCPQASALNSGSWKKLEEKTRQWAQRDSALIIIAGPILTDHLTKTIGKSKVTVPNRFFKVILAPYTNPPRAIAFIMPNGKVPGGIQQAVVTVDQVEQITGFDFFAALPDDIENTIESQSSFATWSRK